MIALAYILTLFLAPTIATVVIILFNTLPVDNLAVRTLRGAAFGLSTVGAGWIVFRVLHQQFGIGPILMLMAACFLNDYSRLQRVGEPLRTWRAADLWGDAIGIGVAGYLLLAW